ncbi:MAG: insulinase family protein [Candidatus Cyclobacteriaceae bacterium M2_1C_046]
MKSIKYIFLLILVSSLVHAQVDRSIKPEPGPAPKIELGEYQTFELKNGLKVIVVENHKLPRIAFHLIVDRDPILEGDKVGFTSMAGNMLRRGTKTRSKDELDREIDYIGATLSTGSNSIYAASLTRHKDKLLELMTDVLYNPIFPEEELDKVKKQTKSNLASSKDSPDAIAQNVSNALLYGKDHPYGEVQREEDIDNISVQDLALYYNTYFKPNISYLAMVGDITPKEAKKLAEKYFEKWTKGEVPSHSYKTPEAPEQTVVALVDRPAAVQTVVDLSYPIELKPGTPDVIKARVVNQVLGGGSSGRLFKNVRGDKGYTYGAYSSIGSDDLIGYFSAGASVRTEVTDSAVHEFIKEMERIRNETVSERELLLAKNTISGSFARSLENPQTIASFAINTAMFNLPQDYYANYVKNIQQVSQEEVMATAKKYIQPDNMYIIAVGNADEIKNGLSRFGEVQLYDMYGDRQKASTVDISDLPDAQQVLKNYVEAIGGKERLQEVNNIIINSTANMQGMTLNIKNVSKVPGRAVNSVMMNGMAIQEVIYNQGKAKMTMQGREMPVNETMLEEMKYNTSIFPELEYENLNIETEVKGVKQVNGEDAYVVQIKYPTGTTKTEYFSVESGLKLKTEGLPTGSITYNDYKEVEGIKFPHTMNLSTPQGPLKTEVAEIKINTDISEEMFRIN